MRATFTDEEKVTQKSSTTPGQADEFFPFHLKSENESSELSSYVIVSSDK